MMSTCDDDDGGFFLFSSLDLFFHAHVAVVAVVGSGIP
jgi:hypothetical protein